MPRIEGTAEGQREEMSWRQHPLFGAICWQIDKAESFDCFLESAQTALKLAVVLLGY